VSTHASSTTTCPPAWSTSPTSTATSSSPSGPPSKDPQAYGSSGVASRPGHSRGRIGAGHTGALGGAQVVRGRWQPRYTEERTWKEGRTTGLFPSSQRSKCKTLTYMCHTI
jgi:hypothetical protein